jgi:hypothetical protein
MTLYRPDLFLLIHIKVCREKILEKKIYRVIKNLIFSQKIGKTKFNDIMSANDDGSSRTPKKIKAAKPKKADLNYDNFFLDPLKTSDLAQSSKLVLKYGFFFY